MGEADFMAYRREDTVIVWWQAADATAKKRLSRAKGRDAVAATLAETGSLR